MNSKTAPSIPQPEDNNECTLCGAEDSYVRYDSDTVCSNCGFTPQATASPTDTETAWERFWSHRADEYSGHYGPERKKCVGGFEYPYY